MMETANTHEPPNRTLVVIDGGMNAKAYVQTLPTTQKPKLLEQVRQAIRTRHYSQMTEKAYVHWIKRFIFFHNKRHPMDMAETEIAQFLSSLATRVFDFTLGTHPITTKGTTELGGAKRRS